MALITCRFYSDVLGTTTALNVILPKEEKKKYPVLFLLHGMGGDHTVWIRKTSVERYADEAGLAVVMPDAGSSFYTDMVHGGAYWTFVSEEVPRLARRFFPLSGRPEETFAAGMSMGGYGALKLALRFPERFSAAASISGVTDAAEFGHGNGRQELFRNIFGGAGAIPGTPDDLFFLAGRLAASGRKKPRIYLCCGTKDGLYDMNVRFRDHLRRLSYSVTCAKGKAGHEWGYWDEAIRDAIRFFTENLSASAQPEHNTNSGGNIP